MTGPRLYGELADWWPLLSAPEDYEEEAGIFIAAIDECALGPVENVLELGCGGGNSASFFKKRFRMTLTDRSPEMLDVSRRLNPECEHEQGDMRTLRLGRTFDAVFVHDAVAYMTTEADLEAAISTAYEHLEPGGLALFVPDDTTETYRREASTGGHDGEGRSLRYMQWDEEAEPGQTVLTTKFVYTLREGDEERVVTDCHLFGLFPRATWLDLFTRVGFDARTLAYKHSSFRADAGHEIFVGIRSGNR